MEDFVTFEQAKKLKELGFDWCCHYRYNIGEEITPNIIFNRDEVDSDDLCINVNGHYIGAISAPTLAQAQKWLFKTFRLWVEVTIDDSTEQPFIFCIYRVGNCNDDLSYNGCDTRYFYNPNEALSAGIDKSLELLKQN